MGKFFQKQIHKKDDREDNVDGADFIVAGGDDSAAATVGDALDRLERLARGDISVRPAADPIMPEQSDDDLLKIARDPVRLRETCIVSLLKAANRADTMSQRIQALKAAADLGAVAEGTKYRVAHNRDGMTVNVLSVQGALMKAKELTLESTRPAALSDSNQPATPTAEPIGAPSF